MNWKEVICTSWSNVCKSLSLGVKTIFLKRPAKKPSGQHRGWTWCSGLQVQGLVLLGGCLSSLCPLRATSGHPCTSISQSWSNGLFLHFPFKCCLFIFMTIWNEEIKEKKIPETIFHRTVNHKIKKPTMGSLVKYRCWRFFSAFQITLKFPGFHYEFGEWAFFLFHSLLVLIIDF